MVRSSTSPSPGEGCGIFLDAEVRRLGLADRTRDENDALGLGHGCLPPFLFRHCERSEVSRGRVASRRLRSCAHDGLRAIYAVIFASAASNAASALGRSLKLRPAAVGLMLLRIRRGQRLPQPACRRRSSQPARSRETHGLSIGASLAARRRVRRCPCRAGRKYSGRPRPSRRADAAELGIALGIQQACATLKSLDACRICLRGLFRQIVFLGHLLADASASSPDIVVLEFLQLGARLCRLAGFGGVALFDLGLALRDHFG